MVKQHRQRQDRRTRSRDLYQSGLHALVKLFYLVLPPVGVCPWRSGGCSRGRVDRGRVVESLQVYAVDVASIDRLGDAGLRGDRHAALLGELYWAALVLYLTTLHDADEKVGNEFWRCPFPSP